jgi:hypothetical protein
MEHQMPASDSTNTTIPTPPTIAEMDAMWLAKREADILDADVRAFERRRAAFAKFVYGEEAA